MKRIFLVVLAVLVMLTLFPSVSDAASWGYYNRMYIRGVDSNNWQVCLQAGYGFRSIGAYKNAHDAFIATQNIANSQNNWQGCVKAGHGLRSLNEPKAAYDAFDSAYNIAVSQRSRQGCLACAKGFQLIGYQKAAQRAYEMARTFY